MIKHKAIMIGAGLANMAAAVYLIQEAHWQGDQITFYSLDDHGSNDGAPTVDTVDEYWNKNHPMENTKGYVARGGRMLNYRTYVDRQRNRDSQLKKTRANSMPNIGRLIKLG